MLAVAAVPGQSGIPMYNYAKYTVGLSQGVRATDFYSPCCYSMSDFTWHSLVVDSYSDGKIYYHVTTSAHGTIYRQATVTNYTTGIFSLVGFYSARVGGSEPENAWLGVTGYNMHEVAGAYVTTIQSPLGIYPDNGKHSDGYWYVKGALA